MTDPVTAAQVAESLRRAGVPVETRGDLSVMLAGVSQDSRTTVAGDLFLAWEGAVFDAHDFVAGAAERGAVAAVVERLLPQLALPQIAVPNGRVAAAVAADLVLGSPWRDLFTVGVTGTNGKTTTALLIRHLLGSAEPAAAIGTLGVVDPDGQVRPDTEGLTTPGPVLVSRWLRELADRGVSAVTLEASSHALEQHRLDGLRLDVAVFTNLSQDHLDYHADLSEYRDAKARLIELVRDGGTVVVNVEDRAWDALPLQGRRSLGYGIDTEAGLRADDLILEAGGSRFTLRHERETAPVRLPLLGRFNVENALAAGAVGIVRGIALHRVAEVLGSVPQVPGRMEVVVPGPVAVLIDFAHTPDALVRVLATLRPLVEGRVIVVFGAGGDRDRRKRSLMGQAVALGADVAVVTSDNPRTEDPDAIIDEVVAGMEGASFHRFADRREAIGHALSLGQPGDLVLLAGKGHERYQIVGRDKLPFDEREVVLDFMGRAA